jgi:hypothetical protein
MRMCEPKITFVHDAPLLEEGLRIGHIFTDRARLPCPEGAGRVDLIECRSAVHIEPSNKQ